MSQPHLTTMQDAARRMVTPARIRALETFLSANAPSIGLITGLAGSSPAMLFGSLKSSDQPKLIVGNDDEDAGYLYHDLCRITDSDSVAIFPSGYKRDIRFGQPDLPMQILRTETIDAWHEGRLQWIVTSPEALAERVPAPKQLDDLTVRLRKGEEADPQKLIDRLIELGFNRVDYVYEPGQFARRGSIVDIFSFASELPFRIDFFDTEVDSIRTFDIETQLSEKQLDRISIIPPASSADSSDRRSLLDFLPVQALFCRSKADLTARVRHIATSEMSAAALHADDDIDRNAMNNVVDPDAFETRLKELRLIEFKAAPEVPVNAGATRIMRCDCSPQALYHKNFDIIASSFSDFIKKGFKIFILSDSEHQIERLRIIFSERGDDISFLPVAGTLHQGFIDEKSKTCFFTDHQIFDRFHKYNLKSDRARSGKLALSLKELSQIEVGDFIVHSDHGIGRFAGLVRSNVNGHTQEMIKLLYQNDDILMVSIHALHKLSKYRGKEGIPPKINRLGNGAWQRLKERTKSKVKDIARDLIKLYAARKEKAGFAFSPDSYLQQELEASFIYEDTPDQLKATKAIKADMERPIPMDRLVCGDVGFGKTELAIRAAFKAAVDGKQTAVLVPTTVLALQHFHTFSDRLKDFPVKVDFLSRARTAKDTKRILSELSEGKIDILIGTHKLIGKNVIFKDLGLLVVDEEQKFGVAVKEKLKQLKVNVDTLTMSATPIPRTLQFSLMGARDLSSLNTPPANRHPIVTTVAPFDDELVKEAVSFELSRNGQIFMISNRIEQLSYLEQKLHDLVPGVRVVVGHGQMPPEKLEKAIIDFAAGDYDVLLSTTIVENGIDMPNVNTMIINNAQNFGLSELHQLRGRVGRSSRKAFCYMLVPPQMPLTPVARRRLQAIESFSDLGAGIHIAMQDLDIRGAGNLLGAEQSGFIADIGYETYQRILKESVAELRTEEFADIYAETPPEEQEFTTDCTIDSDLELLLPATYVPQESERIALYQKLDNMESAADVAIFENNLRDRFGELPETVKELLRIVPLRITAKRLGIERLYLKEETMRLYFVSQENKAYYNSPAFGRVLSYVQLSPRRCEFRQHNGINSIIIHGVKRVEEALDILTTVLTLPSN